MKIIHLFLLFIAFCITGCTSHQLRQDSVYSRTKDIRFSGRMSVQKGEPMLSVTWKYAKQHPPVGGIVVSEEVHDCFRSELVYDGATESEIRFLIKNHICGTYSPVSVETITVEQPLPAKLIFYSIPFEILEANLNGLVFESKP